MKSLTNKTGYRGVFKRSNGRYIANIQLFGKVIALGAYDTAKEAADVYDIFDLKYATIEEALNVFPSGKYLGVYPCSNSNRFEARIRGAQIGTFDTEAEAAIAVNSYLDRFGVPGPRNDITISELASIQEKYVRDQENMDLLNLLKQQRKPPTKITKKQGKEWKIQQDIIRYLTDRNWLVRIVHASLYNFGFPDLWCAHKEHGERWIEVKVPQAYVSFTAAQKKFFPLMLAAGVQVYILTGATQGDYDRLFKKSNYWIYNQGIHDGK